MDAGNGHESSDLGLIPVGKLGARGVQHLLQAGVHFFFFNELAPVGLCDAFPDGGAKAASS
jgi:hypothetical protein